VESGFLLNVVIRESSTIFKLLSGEDQSLLIRGNSFLVLNLGLDIVDCVGGLDFESDRLSGEGLSRSRKGYQQLNNRKTISPQLGLRRIRDNAYALPTRGQRRKRDGALHKFGIGGVGSIITDQHDDDQMPKETSRMRKRVANLP
jgi:hypothetical protein